MKNRIVIKIGSRVLTDDGGLLDKNIIKNFVEDIAHVRDDYNTDVVIVSSGAVLSGRSILGGFNDFSINAQGVTYGKDIVKEQILASVGQVELISKYKREFQKYDINCSQILTTRRDFADRHAYLSLKTVIENSLRCGICPLFNENDVLSPEELDFSDNDQLAYMVAAMISASYLFILTNVDGVYDGSPSDPGSKIISHIDDASQYFSLVDDNESKGKGGMRSKLLSADIITSLGLSMYIANGTEKHVISRILSGENLGTFFPSKSKKKKGIKPWLATSASSSGKIIVSTYLADILRNQKPASILFSGIESISGDFAVKDVVDILDEDGVQLARGVVKFSAEDLRLNVQKFVNKTDAEKAQSKSHEIIAIHYDYLVYVQSN